MYRVVLAMAIVLALPPSASASHGIITVNSVHTVRETADRLEIALGKKGMKVFARIDHAEGAASVGQELRPTVLVIFGNPVIGTALMLCSQTAGIDLPLKALVWEDSAGRVKLSYTAPAYLADRHGITDCGETLGKMSKALKGFAAEAAGP